MYNYPQLMGQTGTAVARPHTLSGATCQPWGATLGCYYPAGVWWLVVRWWSWGRILRELPGLLLQDNYNNVVKNNYNNVVIMI